MSTVTPKKDAPKKAARTVKPLPLEVIALTDKDSDMFVISMENDPNTKSTTYGNEFSVVTSVKLKDGGQYNLKSLTVEQTRVLCRNIGVLNCGSMNKFCCRKAIANFITYQSSLMMAGLNPRSNWARVTSTVLRAVNVIFSETFIDAFLTVNDRKGRKDHEIGSTCKSFWIGAALAHNNCGEYNDDMGSEVEGDDSSTIIQAPDEFEKLVFPSDDMYLDELVNNKEINLRVVDNYQTESFRKKITTLFKIRRTMKKNMTTSGTHDSDPWNFVEAAMKDHSSVTKVSVYYFYVRCEAHPGVDAAFQPFMDPILKGSTIDINDEQSVLSSGTRSSKKQKMSEDQLSKLVVNSDKMLAALEYAR
jgi:hypothetical protein